MSEEKGLNAAELEFIQEAAHFLEHPGILLKSVNWLGGKVDHAVALLPDKVKSAVGKASKAAISQAFRASLATLPSEPASPPDLDTALTEARKSRRSHVGSATLIGALGGFWGLPALALELPAVTVVMMRGIADTAQKMGYHLNDAETRLECLYVFSLGTESSADDSLESGYYASRAAFAETIRQAGAYLAVHGTSDVLRAIETGSAPAVVNLLARIASQFELRVSRKLIAQAAPLAGAAGGAAINALFADYFQRCAAYHFGLRRLEQERGRELTRAAFEDARKQIRATKN